MTVSFISLYYPVPTYEIYVAVRYFQTFAVGVMVPDPAVLVKWAKDKVGVTGTIQELCQNKVITGLPGTSIHKAITSNSTSEPQTKDHPML